MKFIKKYHNVILPEKCEELINLYLNKFKDLSTSKSSNLNYTVKEICLKNFENPDLIKFIKNICDDKIKEYFSYVTFPTNNFYYFSHISFMHHKENYNIPFHYDSELDFMNEEEKLRRFAILIYLNGDFDGGELIFPVQKEIIKPEAGLMTIFPTSFMYPHLTSPSLGRDRYVLRISYFLDKKRIFGDINQIDGVSIFKKQANV
jgi:hypothetical protein